MDPLTHMAIGAAAGELVLGKRMQLSILFSRYPGLMPFPFC
jgi:hypothetical protein